MDFFFNATINYIPSFTTILKNRKSENKPIQLKVYIHLKKFCIWENWNSWCTGWLFQSISNIKYGPRTYWRENQKERATLLYFKESVLHYFFSIVNPSKSHLNKSCESRAPYFALQHLHKIRLRLHVGSLKCVSLEMPGLLFNYFLACILTPHTALVKT